MLILRTKDFLSKYHICYKTFNHLKNDGIIISIAFGKVQFDEHYFNNFEEKIFLQKHSKLAASKKRWQNIDYYKKQCIAQSIAQSNISTNEKRSKSLIGNKNGSGKRSESTKALLSVKTKESWTKALTKENHKIASINSKEKRSIACKKSCNTKICKLKSYLTKKQNNSFNSSKSEQYIKELLEQKFNKVHSQYRSELYPFNCDFYIKDLNLYIECHFNWTHGRQQFNKIDTNCIEQLNSWKEKAKTSKYYQNAIYTWTDLDVRKRQCAIDNKLNWMAFYSLEEFSNWLKVFNIKEINFVNI